MRSIRSRLTLAFAITLGATLLVFAGVMLSASRRAAQQVLQQRVENVATLGSYVIEQAGTGLWANVVVGEALHFLHAAGKRADRDVLRRADGARLDHEVAHRLRLAEQRLALRFVCLGQRLFLVDAVVHLAFDDLSLAAAAGAVAAAVGKHQMLAQGSREDGFPLLHAEFVAARLDLDLTHKMQA